ncbi:hypothetical protein [Frigoriglobus tundricola]|uniref:Lipoprotein n=1 Tax=Frigoriglobus tundricola TaxID=2774151 RepID=A0A6M5YF47_9BACT|nr:hypothetical protein [Frigoriglobus tundricola]QJW92619.1 hypothetical protein FTUN_0116 [Frigoriglobus tundricola]
MNRLAALAAGCALLSIGCVHDGEGSVWKLLTGSEPTNRVATPDPKALPPASMKTATRVELVGRKVIEQNTFSGVEPHFMTIGIKETALFHRGANDLIISEGLVEKCGSDAELAAVLCSELAQMVVEKRMSKALNREEEPPVGANAGTPLFPDGAASEVGKQAGSAPEKPLRGSGRTERPDAGRIARDLLSGAGYNPMELDRVQPLLKPSERGEKLRKQMGASAPAPEPVWQK